jgi:prepilin-type N-terminal cleavage/methylation domain-containing protein
LLRKGFSLFEMLICLIIISGFFLEATAFVTKFNHSKLDAIAKEISTAVRFAKFYAIIKGEKLILKCSHNEECSQGMILYSANQVVSEVSGNAGVIKKWCWHHNKNKITWHGFNASNELIFTPDIKHNTANGKFSIFYQDSLYITLVVNRYGKIRKVF